MANKSDSLAPVEGLYISLHALPPEIVCDLVTDGKAKAYTVQEIRNLPHDDEGDKVRQALLQQIRSIWVMPSEERETSRMHWTDGEACRVLRWSDDKVIIRGHRSQRVDKQAAEGDFVSRSVGDRTQSSSHVSKDGMEKRHHQKRGADREGGADAGGKTDGTDR